MLSKKAKYAINALVYLAKEFQQGNHNTIQIATIAESEHIPQKFLEAILLELRKAGILSSKKGKGGGYFLLQKPGDINMAEIMRLIDGPIALLPCVSHRFYGRCDECKNEALCGIRDVFHDVRNQTFQMLSNTTLETIIQRSKELAAQQKLALN